MFVTCTLLNCNDGFEGIRTVEKSEYATEKHKLVWLIPMDMLDEDRSGTIGDSVQGVEVGGSVWNKAIGLWEKGTLHVVSAGSLAQGSWRMSVTPPVPTAGEYVGILLQWVGDALFHYTAMQHALKATNTDGPHLSLAQNIGALNGIFVFYPEYPPLRPNEEGRTPVNLLFGKLPHETIMSLCGER